MAQQKIKLSDFAGKLVADNEFIKFSIGGFAGSGKSRTCSEFVAGAYADLKCTKPVLLIDNERGARFLEKFFSDLGIEVLVKDTTTLADVLAAFKYLEQGEVDFVFIDSLTKVWYQFVRDYRQNHNNRRMTLNDWGVLIPEWQERFSDKLVEVKGNIAFTGRGGYEYELEEVEEGGKTKKQFVRSGVKMKLQGETAFETDINIWMEVKEEVEGGRVVKQWREALVMKDRSATIDGKVFINPSYKDLKPAIDYIRAVPRGEVKGISDATNLAPSDTYPGKKKEREEALEVIMNSFDQLGISPQSGEGKKLKLDLWEMVFKTNSKQKVDGMKLNHLLSAGIVLVEFKNRMGILIEEGSTPSPELYKSEMAKVLKEMKLDEAQLELIQ